VLTDWIDELAFCEESRAYYERKRSEGRLLLLRRRINVM